jgi:hypothetical protein
LIAGFTKEMGDQGGGLEKAVSSLKLSVVEKKGIQIGRQFTQEGSEEVWQEVGKAMTDRPISVEVIHHTLD